MKYVLDIVQEADGEKNAVTVAAEGQTVDGSLILKYNFDDAEYELILSDKFMTQRRRGEINLFMQFKEGAVTACRMENGGMCGEFEIFTHELTIISDGADCSARCEFSDKADGARTRLSVSASCVN